MSLPCGRAQRTFDSSIDLDRERITEVKLTLAGERKEFDCELLTRSEGEAVVIYRMPREVQLEDVLLREGTLSLGYF